MRGDAAQLAFAGLLACTALALVAGLEFVRVEDDIDRMNSVFKFYLAGVDAPGPRFGFPAVAHGDTLAYVRGTARVAGGRLGRRLPSCWCCAPRCTQCWAPACVLPTGSTQSDAPLTLDGAEYAQGTVYRDAEGPIDLEADFEGIRWLLQNVEGSPITLEGQTPLYRWGGRVSVYTGLPGVVGWEWHQIQQRGVHGRDVSRRVDDVRHNLLHPERARGRQAA